ncbi:MAG: hypothetical protein IJ233_06415 [Pyramidobacter sp.]|nr:hypothetical protein [Pyramidobacter sp.]
MKKSFIAAFAIVALAASSAFATVQLGIPNDATNGARAIKLLEKAGLITVDPAAGFSPELKDITGAVYDVEVVPVAANTLPSTLDDFAASTINGTYAIPAGFVPSRDALIIEKQDEGAENPFVNIIACRAGEKDNPVFQKIVSAYQTQLVAQFILVRFKEAYFPAWKYEPKFEVPANFVESYVGYQSSKDGKTVVKLGVCGSAHDQWDVVQKILDDRGDNIYIQLVEFDAYNLPNEALNSGEIDLNAFQHKAYLNKEIASQGYKLEVAGDTIMAPLSLYSRKVKTLDELKALAGKK